MSLLKTNEIQNYNGSSLTLTASTVSTSAQLNTGGNISVTGSLNVSDDSTTRTNLGLGTIATQDSSNVNLTGGTIGSGVVFPTFVGMIASFAMSSAPTGWIVCNGAEYAIANYGDLYTAIGTTWGALTNGSGGAGSTHFRVPDLRGAFLRGTGSHGSSTMANGNAFAGPSVGSFENDQFQGHRTRIIDYGISVGGAIPNAVETNGTNTNTGFDAVIITDGTNGTPREGDETRPFNAGINYCIKY